MIKYVNAVKIDEFDVKCLGVFAQIAHGQNPLVVSRAM